MQPQLTNAVSIPAPIGGINALDGLMSMPATDSIFAYNMIPARYGLRVRKGYRAWVTNMTGGAVRSVIPFNDVIEGGGNDELFAVTADGIWDCSASTSTPTKVVTFTTTTGDAGWGSWVLFTTAAGQFLVYVDEVNGYRTYNGTSWVLYTTTEITGGVDPDDFVFVTSWKNRLWFVEGDTASAWYLPAGSISGAATEFNFGSKFKHGGTLVGLYNWTVDGGDGIDDYLVAISSGGDVVLYKGTDPASANTFAIHGQWYIGDLPAGRRIATSFGGDLLLITRSGVIPLSALVSGRDATDPTIYVTAKISQLIQSELAESADVKGWDVALVPGENLFLISAPKRTGFPHVQFAQSLTNRAWGIFRDLPYVSGAASGGQLYFGDTAGTLYVHTGNLDNVNLAGSSFEAIEFSILGSFQAFQASGQWKRVHFIRPRFVSVGLPVFSVKAVYDFEFQEASTPTGVPSSESSFDAGLWDVAVWGGGVDAIQSVRGTEGMGFHVAIALKGQTFGDCTLVGYEVMGDVGGML